MAVGQNGLRDLSDKVTTRFSRAELAAIDAERGAQSRGSFIRRAVKELLAGNGRPVKFADPAVAAPHGCVVPGAEKVLARVEAELAVEREGDEAA